MGGGAVFFHLRNTDRLPDDVLLYDHNPELINAYRVVRNEVESLLEQLNVHRQNHSKDYYYQIRNLDRQPLTLSDVERAARTIYLNKTCFNGLYRVNSKGQFNVPMGRYKNPAIAPEAALRAAGAALQQVILDVVDFRSLVTLAQPGDFYYFDPPYDPLSKTASFTSYTAHNFKDQDQRDLAQVFKHLTALGCYCMLSNSHTPFIRKLYQEFRIEIVYAKRAVNSKADGRGAVEEVLVLNY